jgi:hypothetical protein
MSSSAWRALKDQPKPAPFLVRRSRYRIAKHKGELGKGIAAGLIGGLIGTIVMTAFQHGWSEASEALKHSQDAQQPSGEGQKQESEDATMKAAGKLGEKLNRPLSQ